MTSLSPERRPLREQADTLRPLPSVRAVTMHIVVDVQHAVPLRQALTRDCSGQSWTISLSLLPGGSRMRLSLTLPRVVIPNALRRIRDVAPGAEFGHVVEIPESPSGAWMDLVHGTRPKQWPSADDFRPRSLGEMLCEAHVALDLHASDQPELFRQVGALAAQRFGLEAEAVTAALAEREALGSTGLGQGIAVPHGRVRGLPQALAFYVRTREPVAFHAPDGRSVDNLVFILSPEWDNNAHLHLLASVARYFCDARFRALLRDCPDAASVCRLFASYRF
ncbi:PTS sugar transporter subunit IIA [Cupriavidus sp. RAF12]|uniref:PTS sugar transporter subunit IIA n=1 Tax=Cupriavidus sp. RAF12 TaxID=3233050 RepID=UPI003F926483